MFTVSVVIIFLTLIPSETFCMDVIFRYCQTVVVYFSTYMLGVFIPCF